MLPRIPPLSRVERHFAHARASNFFSNFGPVASAFEQAAEKRLFASGSAVACGSCTAGLTAALIALGIEGRVLVPAFTFPATATAVRAAGLTELAVDVDASGMIAASAIAKAAEGAGAVIAVRPFGIWSDLGPVAAACREAGLRLIVDSAAALGVEPAVMARFDAAADVEVFSLHATKPFGIGEGGLVRCAEPLVQSIRSALNFGLDAGRSEARGGGLNGKLDELRAAMALTVLEDLPARVAQRRAMAARLAAAARAAGLATLLPADGEGCAPWQCFPVLLPLGTDADRVVAAAAAEGLQARRYYHPLITAQADPRTVPVAADLAERTVCLPVYDGEQAALADAVWAVFARALAAD